jgi:ABC-type transporter Mla MlaB component/tetratricopeptide (TPR) repeat protein
MTKAPADERAAPTRIATRYEIHGVLGRGGMACVYLATDSVSGRKVALKELQLTASQHDRATITALFEREFHTLSQLAHPRVIAVYDYGVSSRGPYYTMELLDGGDLRDRSPVPWRQACGLIFDVCSSLALLHSRRLLHRDITPRNIRCTRDDKAKLIDFGAMASMGSGGAQVVGTPAFTAPETVHRLALDARADLFSLGATLYNALTGHVPYPARTFAEALAAWNVKPLPPSARVPSIPAALDDLVLSLINVEPSLRPQSAFEVMQRLAAIAGLPRDEATEVAAAYLSTPTLVGRDAVLDQLREQLIGAMTGQGGGVLVRGAPGLGRSRLLDACAIEAKTLGATVLRATATGEPEPFSLARGLIEHLLAAIPWEGLRLTYPELFAPPPESTRSQDDDAVSARPILRDFATLGTDKIQQTLCRFMLTVSRSQPLVIAVDDVQRIDPASAAVLAALIDKNSRGNVSVVLTADSDEVLTLALEVLSRRCLSIELQPLSRVDTHALLSSVFGDVANLELVTEEIHTVSLGNPRLCMDMAQHLVDRQLIRYASGGWALPDRLAASDMPRSAEEAMHAKLGQLSAAARCIAEAQSLAYNGLFTAAEYRALRPEADPLSTDHAVTELLSAGIISNAGSAYTITNRVWTATLRAALDPATERARHRALAEMYRANMPLGMIHHLFAGGAEEQGLRALQDRHRDYAKGFDPKIILDPNLVKLPPTYQHALRAAIKTHSTPREISDQRRWAVSLAVAAEGAGYREAAPPWFEQLKHDSGLKLWQEDHATTDPMQRLMNALQAAQTRYLATPEAERVYTVEEAIRLLAEYVVISIAIGASELDTALIASLPPVLEPFVALSPMLDAIWHNARATAASQCGCQFEAAHELWQGVLQKLDALSGQEIDHLDSIRNAVAFALGMMEAQLGMASATSYAARLDHDPLQKLSAVHLRKIVKLQQGDWNGADRLRRDGEVLSLQLNNVQMFKSLVSVELLINSRARDLAAMQQCIEKMRSIAARFPTWRPYLRDAEAHFDLVRGDFAAAKAGFERSLASIDRSDGLALAFPLWVTSRTGLAGALLGLGDAEAARASAAEALEVCQKRDVSTAAHELIRTLALAEATLGHHQRAAERLEALIAEQTAKGSTGLLLGLTYEARARIAIWSKDEAAFAEFSRLAAKEYGRGARSPLAARYEQLVNEATRSGFHAAPDLSDFEPSTMLDSAWTGMTDVPTAVLRMMTGARRTEERAERALRLLCETRKSTGGHLYVVTSEGLRHAASYGEGIAPSSLSDLVDEFLRQEHEKADTMTEIVTGTMMAEEGGGASSVRCGGVTYEMLTLASVVGGSGVVAGVAAIVESDQRVRYVKQAQLLATLASHLIDGGDVTGMRFEVN